MADYGPRTQGAIFEERNKKFEKGPDYTGTFDFTREFIEALRESPRDDRGNVKVRIAGWNKRGPSKDYISCQLELSRSHENRDDRGGDRRDDRGGDRRDDRQDDRGGYDQRDDRRDDRGRDRRRDDRRDEPEEEIPFRTALDTTLSSILTRLHETMLQVWRGQGPLRVLPSRGDG